MRITVLLLIIWALAGLGCGVIFADKLNSFRVGGFPLGFWFAQQGSIVIFVVIILVYGLLMNRLDRRHHEELEEIRRGRAREGSEPASGPPESHDFGYGESS